MEGCEAFEVAIEPSGVGGDRRGREAYKVAGNPGGDREGVGGGVESPQGIDTPRVDALTWGDKTPEVDTKGNGVMREDGQGRGGDGTPPPPEGARTAEQAAVMTTTARAP